MKRVRETDQDDYQRLANLIIRRNLPGLDEQERGPLIAELIEKLHATATEFVAVKRNINAL